MHSRLNSIESGNFFFQPRRLHLQPADLLVQFGDQGVLGPPPCGVARPRTSPPRRRATAASTAQSGSDARRTPPPVRPPSGPPVSPPTPPWPSRPASIRRRFRSHVFLSKNWTNPTRDSTQSRGPVFSVHYSPWLTPRSPRSETSVVQEALSWLHLRVQISHLLRVSFDSS